MAGVSSVWSGEENSGETKGGRAGGGDRHGPGTRRSLVNSLTGRVT